MTDRTAAARMRRLRRRKREGLSPYLIEAPPRALADKLTAIGALDPERIEDPEALRQALSEVIGAWVA